MQTERERLWTEFCAIVGDFGTQDERLEVFEAMFEFGQFTGDIPKEQFS
tara:strand:- start:258 stop:404 length:147 start_codon:yes stop_codon:yes gene_type:complete